MVEQVWIEEGDVIIGKFSFKYFNDLIDYVDCKGLKNDFYEWCKSRNLGE